MLNIIFFRRNKDIATCSNLFKVKNHFNIIMLNALYIRCLLRRTSYALLKVKSRYCDKRWLTNYKESLSLSASFYFLNQKWYILFIRSFSYPFGKCKFLLFYWTCILSKQYILLESHHQDIVHRQLNHADILSLSVFWC